MFCVLITITWNITFSKAMAKTINFSKKSDSFSPKAPVLQYTISPCELDDMIHTLIHHADVTHKTKYKEKLRMGFTLPKIVMLLLVPKADFQITAYTTYSERGRKVIFKIFRGRQCFFLRHFKQREQTHSNCGVGNQTTTHFSKNSVP